MAVLEQDPAACFQSLRCRSRQLCQRSLTIALGEQCPGGLELGHVQGQVWIADGNVGRVGDDEVEAHGPQICEPVAVDQFDAIGGDALDVAARDGECGLRDVGGEHAPAGAGHGQSQSDGAAARPEVDDLGIVGRHEVEGGGDQKFGLRPWNQYRRRDLELDVHEAPAACDVGDGFTLGAAADPIEIACRWLWSDDGLRPGDELAAGETATCRQQKLGIEALETKSAGDLERFSNTFWQHASVSETGEQVGLMFLAQRLDDIVELAFEDGIESVKGEVDAVVGDATLAEIVGANALGAIA